MKTPVLVFKVTAGCTRCGERDNRSRVLKCFHTFCCVFQCVKAIKFRGWKIFVRSPTIKGIIYFQLSFYRNDHYCQLIFGSIQCIDSILSECQNFFFATIVL